jgi:hypothetical protein
MFLHFIIQYSLFLVHYSSRPFGKEYLPMGRTADYRLFHRFILAVVKTASYHHGDTCNYAGTVLSQIKKPIYEK